MSKTLEQIYTDNPSTVIADTDLLYLVQSPYSPGTDSGISGADLKAMFPSGTPSALTKLDDSNVTITLGGTPATSLLQSVSLTMGWNGQLPVSRGGTGLSSATLHNLMIGNGTSALTLLSPSATSGIPLVSLGSSSDPSYGTAVVAGGGTGSTTFTAYSVICAGTTATGAFQNVSGTGTTGDVLTSNGAGTLPTWQPASGGSVTPVDVQRNVFNLGTDTGTLNAYEVILNPDIAPIDGYQVFFSPLISNSIPNPTLKVSTSAIALPITLQNAGQLLPGDLDPNHVAHMIYSQNSSQWVLQNPFCSLQQFYNCLSDTGTANSYIVTLPLGLVQNPAGITFTFSPANTNTTISFIDFGFGPTQIVRENQQPLLPGDIVQDVNAIIIFAPNLTTAQLVNPQTPLGVWQFGAGTNSGVGGDGTATATAAYSLAYGSSSCVASAANSFAFGETASSFGTFCLSFGQSTIAFGSFSIAFGAASNVSGSYNFAFGNGASTNAADYCFAIGNLPVCNNTGSVVWGDSNANPISDTASNQWVTTFAGGYYWYLSSGNLAVSIDTGGVLENHFGLRDLSKLILTPNTGDTVTIVSAVNYLTILKPAGTLASLTIDFGTPSDGIKFKVTTTQIITSVTCTAGTDTIAVPVTSLSAGGGFEMIYDLASTTWYPA